MKHKYSKLILQNQSDGSKRYSLVSNFIALYSQLYIKIDFRHRNIVIIGVQDACFVWQWPTNSWLTLFPAKYIHSLYQCFNGFVALIFRTIQRYRQNSSISSTNTQNINFSLLVDRRRSNLIWVINNFIAWDATYIRGLIILLWQSCSKVIQRDIGT